MPVYRFGPFELDTRTAELRRHHPEPRPDRVDLRVDGRVDGPGSLRVRLRPQPCAALACLVARQGQFVSRQELQRALWPDGTFVHFEDGLNSCIKQIRAALGDSRTSPRYIETLTRRGYRFIMPVTLAVDTPEPADPLVRVRIRLLPVRDLEPSAVESVGHALADALREELAAQLALAAPHDIAVVECGPDLSRSDGTRSDGARPDADAPFDDIGDESADYALAATVRAAGSRVRVTSQLIATRTRQHVWAGAFDASLDDPIDAESALAERIVAGVLGAVRGTAPDSAPTPSPPSARPGPYAAGIAGDSIRRGANGSVSTSRSAQGHRHDHSELTSHRF
jgi:DNA-binding winged helix-turn-helix (wHTH) protein